MKLTVSNLSVSYIRKDFLKLKKTIFKAVDSISFSIRENECLALVGESGCGKSTTGKSIIGLVKPESGELKADNISLYKKNWKYKREFIQKIQIVYQDPYSSLNPALKIASTLQEPLQIHHVKNIAIKDLLSRVSMDTDCLSLLPSQLSGGQRQRINIARALALNPQLLILDEPTASLDVSIKAQILNTLKDIKTQGGSYMLISHDMSSVRYLADNIIVMYMGKIVEEGDSNDLFQYPMHPYTKALISSIPIPDPRLERERKYIELYGEIGDDVQKGCKFRNRCPIYHQLSIEKKSKCENEEPPLLKIEENKGVACHFYKEG